MLFKKIIIKKTELSHLLSIVIVMGMAWFGTSYIFQCSRLQRASCQCNVVIKGCPLVKSHTGTNNFSSLLILLCLPFIYLPLPFSSSYSPTNISFILFLFLLLVSSPHFPFSAPLPALPSKHMSDIWVPAQRKLLQVMRGRAGLTPHLDTEGPLK